MSNYFNRCFSIEQVKEKYRELCKQHHPDLGGDTATMQAINREYAFESDQARRRADTDNQGEAHFQSMREVDELIRQAIEDVIHLEDINIEICGLWVWISGNTKPVKTTLKDAGYKWAKKKLKWYFAGVPSRRGRGRYSMQQIRDRYGSEVVENRPYAKL